MSGIRVILAGLRLSETLIKPQVDSETWSPDECVA